jgi:hypothetical protein
MTPSHTRLGKNTEDLNFWEENPQFNLAWFIHFFRCCFVARAFQVDLLLQSPIIIVLKEPQMRTDHTTVEYGRARLTGVWRKIRNENRKCSLGPLWGKIRCVKLCLEKDPVNYVVNIEKNLVSIYRIFLNSIVGYFTCPYVSWRFISSLCHSLVNFWHGCHGRCAYHNGILPQSTPPLKIQDLILCLRLASVDDRCLDLSFYRSLYRTKLPVPRTITHDDHGQSPTFNSRTTPPYQRSEDMLCNQPTQARF